MYGSWREVNILSPIPSRVDTPLLPPSIKGTVLLLSPYRESVIIGN